MVLRKAIFIPTAAICGLFICSNCEPGGPDGPDSQYNGRTSAVFKAGIKYGHVKDVEENTYRTVVIGNQEWMAENLRTTRYRNGDAIAQITEPGLWAEAASGACCTYNSTLDYDTIATYGRLYNWYAVSDERGLSPKGWRVATVYDWIVLIEFLGGDSVASNAMKEEGTFHWEDAYQSTNSSGFTALPGGWRYREQQTRDMGFYAVFWAVNEFDNASAAFLYLYNYSSIVYKGYNFKVNGYSIRCVRD